MSPKSRAFPSLSQAQVDLTMYPSPSQAEHNSFSTLNSSGFYLCRISYFLPAPLLFILFRLGLGHPELMAVEPSASGGWRSERLPGPAGSGLHHELIHRSGGPVPLQKGEFVMFRLLGTSSLFDAGAPQPAVRGALLLCSARAPRLPQCHSS